MSVYARWVRTPHDAGGPRGDGGSVHLVHRRARKATVCESFDEQTELEQLRETIRTRYLPADVGSAARVRARDFVTRHLKRMLRCTGDNARGIDVVRDLMSGSPADADRAIADSRTPLGGYAVAAAAWAGPASSAFVALGARVERLEQHEIPGEAWGDGTPYPSSVHRRESNKDAPGNSRKLAGADILAASGHHYTSHLAPGFFTNSETRKGFDLRYNLHTRPGGFADVRLVAISGCSSLCRLAQRVLRPCFPAARFLGAQKTMTLNAGKWIWPSFRQILLDAGTPLLLDNTQDLDLLAQAWNRSCLVMTRQEGIRLLKAKGSEPTAARIRAKQRQLVRRTGLGYAEGEEVHVLEDASGSQRVIAITDPANNCQRKADERHILVPPEGFVLPKL